jgi:mono/diheme cytochrome c family protein
MSRRDVAIVSAVRRTVFAAILTAVAVSIVASFPGVGSSAPKSDDLATGRQLYRKFCGQCHALSAANAAGFGSNNSNGLGDLGGPSFNELRVPYSFSVTAVVEPTGGHEVVKKRITTKQLRAVATYIAKVTRNHPVPAFPTSG